MYSAHTQENDVGLEVTPFERILHCHDEELLCSAPNKEEFIITPSFLQHNHETYLTFGFFNFILLVIKA
jgi:hypothetical protein